MEKATLYGSRSKGNYKNGANLTLDVVYKILDDIDELLLPSTIDLSIFNDITDLDVIAHIQRVASHSMTDTRLFPS